MNDTDFTYLVCSDLERDGMYLEMQRHKKAVAEVFYSDKTHQFTISLFEKQLPADSVERLIALARQRLPLRETSE